MTPSVDLARGEAPADSSNEDFLFHLYRGSELLQDNRVHEAKEELERALHLQPRDSKGQDLLAVVYFRLGLYPRAIQIYEELRTKNPDDTALLLNLALCYLKTGQPQLARRDLQHLLALNPSHSRAWGYLGFACERLGDLAQAERAFAQGGHRQLARRVAGRTDAQGGPPPSGGGLSKEVRDAAGAAYRELDAGDLSFSLAEPTSDRTNADRVAQNAWSPVELGQIRVNERPDSRALPQPKAEPAAPPTRVEKGAGARPVGPGQVPPNRRPTLIAPVGAPPAHDVPSEYAAVERIPAPSRTLAADDVAPSVPSVRHPVVAVPSPFGPARPLDSSGGPLARRTLPPPDVTPGSLPPTSTAVASVAPVAERMPAFEAPPAVEHPPLAEAASPLAVASDRPHPPQRPAATRFPSNGVVLDRSGLALVRTTTEAGFATRLESIRAQQSQLKLDLLERRKNGKSNGEPFGGVASPMVMATGAGELVLAPRTGRKLTPIALDDDLCFIREDVLLGFSGSLSFENGRLATGEGETIAVVQLRGHGAVVLESIGDTLTLDVGADRSVNVRREAVVGWFGRLVPRALAPSEAPCGQRGLVAFAGEGYVILTSA